MTDRIAKQDEIQVRTTTLELTTVDIASLNSTPVNIGLAPPSGTLFLPLFLFSQAVGPQGGGYGSPGQIDLRDEFGFIEMILGGLAGVINGGPDFVGSDFAFQSWCDSLGRMGSGDFLIHAENDTPPINDPAWSIALTLGYAAFSLG